MCAIMIKRRGTGRTKVNAGDARRRRWGKRRSLTTSLLYVLT